MFLRTQTDLGVDTIINLDNVRAIQEGGTNDLGTVKYSHVDLGGREITVEESMEDLSEMIAKIASGTFYDEEEDEAG